MKNFPHLSPTKGLFKDGLKMVQYGGAYGVLAGLCVVRGCSIRGHSITTWTRRGGSKSMAVT